VGLRLVAALYPWDVLGDPDLLDELRDLGIGRVSLAAYYHAVRAATPRHPRTRVIDAAHTASYIGYDVAVADLASTTPSWTPPDAYLRARDSLETSGIAVDAWITPSHLDSASTSDARHRVVDAFGTPLRHALCPNDPVAAAYIDAVVDAVVATAPRGLVVESLGQLGIDHADLHDKTAGADWSPAERRLLSICCCAGCTAVQGGLGLDPQRIAATVREGLGSGRPGADAALSVLEEPVLAARSVGMSARWEALRRRAGGMDRVAVHATADRWATSPAAPVHLLPGADLAIVDAWSADEAAVRRVRDVSVSGAAIAAYVTVLPPTPLDAAAIGDQWARLRDEGVEELHLYHPGLASDARLTLLHDSVLAAGLDG